VEKVERSDVLNIDRRIGLCGMCDFLHKFLTERDYPACGKKLKNAGFQDRFYPEKHI